MAKQTLGLFKYFNANASPVPSGIYIEFKID
jgi:hypothetical protein